MLSTISWAGIPDWIKRKNWFQHQNSSLLLHGGCVVTSSLLLLQPCLPQTAMRVSLEVVFVRCLATETRKSHSTHKKCKSASSSHWIRVTLHKQFKLLGRSFGLCDLLFPVVLAASGFVNAPGTLVCFVLPFQHPSGNHVYAS